MVDLVAEGAGFVNYYDRATLEVELGTVGFAPGAQFGVKLETLSYDGTDQVGYDLYFRRPTPDEQNCFHASWISPSGSPMQTVTGVFPPPPQGVEWTGTSGATGCLDFTRAVLVVRNYGYPGHWNISFRITLSFIPASLATIRCGYGTRLKAGTPVTVVTSPEFIDLVLASIGVGDAGRAFASIAYQFMDLNALCSSGPPEGVTIDMSTWLSTADSMWKTFQWATWFYACECIPGTPPPLPYDPPSIVLPPSWPAAPPFPCDPADICAALVRIQRQLAAIANTTGRDYELDTLVQRYQLPMGIILGPTHSGLTESGGFHISRLIGVQYHITSRGPDRPMLPGQPGYIKDLGWMSISDGGAMLLERRITRDQERWLPVHAALADTFGYYLTAGTVMDVTELLAEP